MDQQWVLLYQGMASAAHLEHSALNTPERTAVTEALNDPKDNIVLTLKGLNINVSTSVQPYYISNL